MDFKTVNHFITFIKYKMVHIFVEAPKTITNLVPSSIVQHINVLTPLGK